MKDLEPTLKRCSKEMSEAAAKLKTNKREMEQRHSAAELRLRRRPSIGIDDDCPPVNASASLPCSSSRAKARMHYVEIGVACGWVGGWMVRQVSDLLGSNPYHTQ